MSRLKRRLQTLRNETAGPSGPSAALGQRLQRMRPRQARPAAVGSPLDDHALAQRVDGQLIDAGVILLERTVALSEHHGRQPLTAALQQRLDPLETDGPLKHQNLLFMDTETTGLAGGTGTLVFLLGMARVEGSRLKVRQYLLNGFKGEAAMLAHAAQWVDPDATLVSFNGKTFDVPLLATRYRLAGQADPFAPLRHVDLLYFTRRAFANRWEDCRLGTAERLLLGFEREQDLPGAEAPEAWMELVRFGIVRRTPALLRHNHWDLVTLLALLGKLAAVYEDPGRCGARVAPVADYFLRKRGDEAAAFGQLRENAAALDNQGLRELARLHRRRGDWPAAVTLWQRLAAGGCLESLEHLAKYHEHVQRDFHAALQLTDRLIHHHGHCPRHRQRRQRLLRRLGQPAETLF